MTTFDRTPGASTTCRSCERPEHDHSWICDCGVLLGMGGKLPEAWPCKKTPGKHTGATLVCPQPPRLVLS